MATNTAANLQEKQEGDFEQQQTPDTLYLVHEKDNASEEQIVLTKEKNDGVDTEIEKPEESSRVPLFQALFFANGEPLSPQRISEVTALTKEEVLQALQDLKRVMQEELSGIELVEVGDKFQLRTKKAFGNYIQTLRQEKPKKLSPSALETLAIIAYRQPVVRSDIEKIRGVDTSPALKILLERALISIIGHEAKPGNPSLYATTEEFLKLFGIKSLPELPSLREIEAIIKQPEEEEEGGHEELQQKK
jgi:segregation and condensation protein B